MLIKVQRSVGREHRIKPFAKYRFNVFRLIPRRFAASAGRRYSSGDAFDMRTFVRKQHTQRNRKFLQVLFGRGNTPAQITLHPRLTGALVVAL